MDIVTYTEIIRWVSAIVGCKIGVLTYENSDCFDHMQKETGLGCFLLETSRINPTCRPASSLYIVESAIIRVNWKVFVAVYWR